MKWNCFDWFDHYAAEKNGVPKLETQPMHTDAIWKRVQEQAGIAPQPKRNRMHMTKWVAGIAAAAVLVTGGTTVAAAVGYGGLDVFFQSLIGEETPENPEKMAALVTTPAAEFDSTNTDVQMTLLGMYGDNNYALLSFQLTAADGISLNEVMLPYTMTIRYLAELLGYGRCCHCAGTERCILLQSAGEAHRLAGKDNGSDFPEHVYTGTVSRRISAGYGV